MSLQPEQLGQMFRAVASPAAALAFEAPVDAHFDVLFNCPTAGSAPERACKLMRRSLGNIGPYGATKLQPPGRVGPSAVPMRTLLFM